MALFEITVDHERLLQKLKAANKVPHDIDHLRGVNLLQTVDEDQVPGLSVVLGPINGLRRGRRPSAISISNDQGRRPTPRGDRLFRADISDPAGETIEFVRQEREGVALRIFKTGLLPDFRGGTAEDWLRLSSEGAKIRYHGVFPLTADAGTVVGEGLDLDITNQSRVVTDERFGRVSGIAGVSKFRETLVEVVLGGPILVGQINGGLKIVELTPDGWKTYDVTNDTKWNKMFLDLASQDAEYLQAIAADKSKKPARVIRVTQPPSGHPDEK